MLHLLNTTGDRLEVNALFIQPTRWCASSCKGCYVKAHKSENYHTPWEQQARLFEYFYFGQMAHANQITISLDTLPEEGPQRNHMLGFFNSIVSTMNGDPDKKAIRRPQVHITVRNIDTLQSYVPTDSYAIERTFKLFTVVSISDIRRTDIEEGSFIRHSETCRLRERIPSGVHINYNHMCPANVSSLNIKEHIDRLIEIGKTVDSIYMITHKTPVGAPRNDLMRLMDRSRWRSDILYMRTILQSVPENIKKKIQVDGCIQDVVKNANTNLGCSSSVSRFQVWPDGSVSGCPYSFDSRTSRGETADEILSNIRQARKSYDYYRCHLPEIHNSLTRRPKDTRQDLSPR